MLNLARAPVPALRLFTQAIKLCLNVQNSNSACCNCIDACPICLSRQDSEAMLNNPGPRSSGPLIFLKVTRTPGLESSVTRGPQAQCHERAPSLARGAQMKTLGHVLYTKSRHPTDLLFCSLAAAAAAATNSFAPHSKTFFLGIPNFLPLAQL